jgi:hypothetical protein
MGLASAGGSSGCGGGTTFGITGGGIFTSFFSESPSFFSVSPSFFSADL